MYAEVLHVGNGSSVNADTLSVLTRPADPRQIIAANQAD
jgi:hypothetical protein